MTLRIARPWLLGVEPKVHNGGWFTRELIWSFIAGGNSPVPDSKYSCKCALGLVCPGRKANEAHQMMRDLKKESRKEHKTYPTYEPSDADLAND